MSAEARAPCALLSACGSCPLLPLPYGEQLARKQADLAAQLAAAGLDPARLLAPPTPSPAPRHYRHTVKLVARATPSGPRLGLYAPGSHEVVDTAGCVAQSPRLNALLDALRALLRAPGAPRCYDERTREGGLRYVVARALDPLLGEEGAPGALTLTLITASGDHEELRALSEALRARVPALRGALAHTNATPGNAIFDAAAPTAPLWGDGALTATLRTPHGPLALRASADSFSQVSPAAAALAYGAVVEALAPRPGERALDLYCGVGSIALWLARAGCEVVGVEESPSSVADARHNAALNGLEGRARFEQGLAEVALPALARAWGAGGPGGLRGGVASLNPSRRGCQPAALEALCALRPRALAYMSCHPKTLMRDLARLAALGYAPTRVGLFDLFPGTPHYEVVCALAPRAGAPRAVRVARG